MKKFILLSAFFLCSCTSYVYTEECRMFPQQVVVNNHIEHGEAYACSGEDGQWHVKTFKNAAGYDLPAPAQVFYPQPAVIRTTPQTAFTPTQIVTAMPMPHITFYEQ